MQQLNSYRFYELGAKLHSLFCATAQSRITAYLETHVAGTENPKRFGGALHGDKQGYWKYRVGDWRLICEIGDQQILIIVLSLGNRRAVYR